MSELITTLFSVFTTVITSLAGGLKTAFANLLYVDPAASSPEFSPVVLFLFTMAGVGLACGILFKMFALIKVHKRG